MKRSLKLLHTSDIHLDNRVGDEDDHGERGFRAVIDLALSESVDLFLLAGDLFDHNRVKEHCLEFASEQLARLQCPMVMVTGNHDCMADYSIYHKYEPREAGEHIVFLQEEEGALHRLDELGVTVWGRGIVDHHPGHKPLSEAPSHNTDDWYLGITHGYYVNRGAEVFSSLITPEEIESTGFDYLALGHVHVFTTMQHGKTVAAYPGSPNLGQGARESSAALVHLQPESGVSVEKRVLQV